MGEVKDVFEFGFVFKLVDEFFIGEVVVVISFVTGAMLASGNS